MLSELDQEPYDAVCSQWELEERITETLRSGTINPAREASDDPAQTVPQMQESLQVSSRQLCRVLRSTPKAYGVLQAYLPEEETGGRNTTALVEVLTELKEQVIHKLARSNEEESSAKKKLEDKKMKSKKYEEQLHYLEAQLGDSRNAMADEVAANQATLDRLNADLSDLTQSHAESNASLLQEVLVERETNAADQLSRAEELASKSGGLQASFHERLQGDHDIEGRFHRNHQKGAEALEQIMAEYDEKMTAKTRELEDLTRAYERELADYTELNSYFIKIDMDRENERAEDQAIAEEHARELDHELLMVMRVVRIQAIARGLLSRIGISHEVSVRCRGRGGGGHGARVCFRRG